MNDADAPDGMSKLFLYDDELPTCMRVIKPSISGVYDDIICLLITSR